MKLQALSIPPPPRSQPLQHSTLSFFKGNYSPPDQLKLPKTSTEPEKTTLWNRWFQSKPIKPLNQVAESLRANTVRLNTNNNSFNGSGVWIRDKKTGKYYILTCRHLFKTNTTELDGMSEFFFGSRDPKAQKNVSGLAKIIQQYDKKDWLDEFYTDRMYYNDLMLLEPTDGRGQLVSHPPQLATTNLLVSLEPNIQTGDPAIVCSSVQQGFLDKVEIVTLSGHAGIGSDFWIEYTNGRLKNGDSGSAVYSGNGDLIGILIEGNTNGNCKKGRVLNINSLQDFLERQCGLEIG